MQTQAIGRLTIDPKRNKSLADALEQRNKGRVSERQVVEAFVNGITPTMYVEARSFNLGHDDVMSRPYLATASYLSLRRAGDDEKQAEAAYFLLEELGGYTYARDVYREARRRGVSSDHARELARLQHELSRGLVDRRRRSVAPSPKMFLMRVLTARPDAEIDLIRESFWHLALNEDVVIPAQFSKEFVARVLDEVESSQRKSA